MATRLSNDDRRAIDLLLDKATSAQSSFTSATETVDTTRVQAVEKILHLLDGYEAAEPPADLVARTLKRIESAEAQPQTAAMPRTTIMGAPMGENPPA
jgi:hypothetical protein